MNIILMYGLWLVQSFKCWQIIFCLNPSAFKGFLRMKTISTKLLKCLGQYPRNMHFLAKIVINSSTKRENYCMVIRRSIYASISFFMKTTNIAWKMLWKSNSSFYQCWNFRTKEGWVRDNVSNRSGCGSDFLCFKLINSIRYKVWKTIKINQRLFCIPMWEERLSEFILSVFSRQWKKLTEKSLKVLERWCNDFGIFGLKLSPWGKFIAFVPSVRQILGCFASRITVSKDFF